ncbi:cytochrome c oxidase assembly protein PET191-domain-containing protein [Lactifluus subvellereus]|nr:cytochrome c oxidase assembly protein PET191-domain-containing protein [Lactifluus subvellereus]
MSNYCDPLLAALKDCVLHSDCVIKKGNLPSECIKHHIDELPEECRSLRLAAFECKRGMLDMRKRFRGNNAGATAARVKEGSASAPTAELPGTTDVS